MTQTVTFEFAGQRTVIRVIGTNVLFVDLQTNMMSPIEGLKFNPEGIKKEYPDLKDIGDKKELQRIATERFVEKIKNLPSETERVNWLIEEMKSMGYIPKIKQRMGFRPQKIR